MKQVRLHMDDTLHRCVKLTGIILDESMNTIICRMIREKFDDWYDDANEENKRLSSTGPLASAYSAMVAADHRGADPKGPAPTSTT